MTTVYMVQVALARWELRSEHGKILKDDLVLHSNHEAERWALAYVSSFPAWAMVLKPLQERDEDLCLPSERL